MRRLPLDLEQQEPGSRHTYREEIMRNEGMLSGSDLVDCQQARQLLAVEGYIELEMYSEAAAELGQVDPAYLALEQTVVLQLCVYAGLHKWKQAHKLATALGRQDPNNPQWPIWAASATCRLQSVEAAKGILLKALVTHPDNANIHYNLSCYETRLQHFRTAQRHLARAIQLDPRFKLVAMDDADLEPLWMNVTKAPEDLAI
jgi:tetratricopeptide (TPR) repeat protein